MTDRPAPRLTERAEAERVARQEREAAALRANLRRRKQQQRPGHDGSRADLGFGTVEPAAEPILAQTDAHEAELEAHTAPSDRPGAG